jgi:phosphotransferase system enzyme I (PtsI)
LHWGEFLLTLKGVPAGRGIAVGRLFLLPPLEDAPAARPAKDKAYESGRVESAIKTAKGQLTLLCEKVLMEVGEKAAEIFGIHIMMLEDSEFIDNIHGVINEGNYRAECAVHAACEWYADVIDSSGNPYMQERGADLRDLKRRVTKILSGCGEDEFSGVDGPVVLAAPELLPSQTVGLENGRVLAFLSGKGNVNCHASVLARMLGIPAVISLGDDFAKLTHGELCIVDGQKGRVTVSPTPEAVEEAVRCSAVESNVTR